MWRTFTTILLSLTLAMLTGCNTVLVDEPFGRPLVEHHAAKYAGLYQSGETVLHVRQTGESTLQGACIDFGQKDGFRMLVADIDLRYWGGKTIAFTRLNYDASSVDPDDNEDPAMLKRWHFAYVVDSNAASNPPRPLIFAIPRKDVFAGHVQAGRLPGEPIGNHTLLEPAAAEPLEQMLLGRGAEELFDHTEPVVFSRLSTPKE